MVATTTQERVARIERDLLKKLCSLHVELLGNICWDEEEGREMFELHMPADELMTLLQRLHRETTALLVALALRCWLRATSASAGWSRTGTPVVAKW
jgi:hypothetical protein